MGPYTVTAAGELLKTYQLPNRQGVGMYRSTWICFVTLTGIAGLWASVQALSLGGVLSLFLSMAVGGACVRLAMTKDGDQPQWRRATKVGIAWGAAVVAAAGLVVWLGISGLVVVTVLAILSPTVLSAAAKRYRVSRYGEARPPTPGCSSWSDFEVTGRDKHTERDGGAPSVSDASLQESPWMQRPLRSMDDPSLCLAWRISYVALQQPLALPARVRLVERRQQFLDEFERRNARGFSAWLASGARAAGDPSKYISSGDRPAHGRDQP